MAFLIKTTSAYLLEFIMLLKGITPIYARLCHHFFDINENANVINHLACFCIMTLLMVFMLNKLFRPARRRVRRPVVNAVAEERKSAAVKNLLRNSETTLDKPKLNSITAKDYERIRRGKDSTDELLTVLDGKYNGEGIQKEAEGKREEDILNIYMYVYGKKVVEIPAKQVLHKYPPPSQSRRNIHCKCAKRLFD